MSLCQPLDFTVIGPAVNLRRGSRIDQAGSAPRMLFSSAFARICPRPAGPLRPQPVRRSSEPDEGPSPAGVTDRGRARAAGEESLRQGVAQPQSGTSNSSATRASL